MYKARICVVPALAAVAVASQPSMYLRGASCGSCGRSQASPVCMTLSSRIITLLVVAAAAAAMTFLLRCILEGVMLCIVAILSLLLMAYPSRRGATEPAPDGLVCMVLLSLLLMA